MAEKCCDEYGCRRKQPFRIRKGPFSGRFMLISRWKHNEPNVLYAIEKHDIHDELVDALLHYGWTPPPERAALGGEDG